MLLGVMAFGFMIASAPGASAQLDAQSTGLEATAGQAGYGSQPVEVTTVIGRIIAIGIGLLGLVLFIFIVYGGIIWMSAQGDPQKVTKAQGMITNAVIGMIIVMAAYAISNFVITQLGSPETGIVAP